MMPSKTSRSSGRRVCVCGGGGGGSHVGRWRTEPVCLLALLTGTSASGAGADAEAGATPRWESSFPARLSQGDFPEATPALWVSNLRQALCFLLLSLTLSLVANSPAQKNNANQSCR